MLYYLYVHDFMCCYDVPNLSQIHETITSHIRIFIFDETKIRFHVFYVYMRVNQINENAKRS